MKNVARFLLSTALIAFAVFVLASGTLASAQTETILYNFSDRTYPLGGLVFDTEGNLYGTTFDGGTYGYGTVYELSSTSGGGWTETEIYSFGEISSDAIEPEAALVFDAEGNLYGTSVGGGSGSCYQGTSACGTVFELTPTKAGGWKEKVIYSFTGDRDGFYPNGSLLLDEAGDIFGTTVLGGLNKQGTAFELVHGKSGWRHTVLHAFAGGSDGSYPYSNLISDASGDLYGTTAFGGGAGICNVGSHANHFCGTVFQLTPPVGGTGGWTENVLYSFPGGIEGAAPFAGLVFDQNGNLYGATSQGGTYRCVLTGGPGCGTVFELASGTWTETVLYIFQGGNDGADPNSVVFDGIGNMYGTTQAGGGGGECFYSGSGGQNGFCGSVFELSPASGGWTETILHGFQGYPDGAIPNSALVLDPESNLYGITIGGGQAGDGTVFEITP